MRTASGLLALVLVTSTAPGVAADFGPARCEATKLTAAAGAARRLIECHAQAMRAGATVDPACVSAVGARLSAALAKAEVQACPTNGTSAVVVNALATLGIDLTTIVGGGPSRCDGRKLIAAGKRVQAALKAQAAHTRAPADDRLETGLAKANLTLTKQILTAETASGCTSSGSAPGILTRTDSGIADVVDAIRGTMRGLAAARGRTIGAAVRANLLAASNEGTYRSTVLRQLSAVTAEYEFMWGNMEPTRGTFVLGPIDTIVAFSQQHGLALKGAPLVWHLILPPWVDDAMTATDLQAALDERIDGVLGAYAGRVTTWDVVNEAVVDAGAALRDSIFLRKLGPDYIRNAFVRARQADPNALLFYNDFLADGVNQKSDFIYDLITGLLAQGTPIDGVSFQMHLGGGFGAAPTRDSIRQNLERFAALGLRVRVSEMDVQIHDLPGEASDQLRREREIYHDVVAACLDVPACDSLSFWGISDAHTWVKDYLGINDRPLPFDAFYQPKAAFFGVRDALLGD